MPRMRRIVRFSLPPKLAEEYESLASELGKTKGELFRKMMIEYKAKRQEDELYRIQRRISRKRSRPKPFTEKEIERIVFEDR